VGWAAGQFVARTIQKKKVAVIFYETAKKKSKA
jgi:hypothetical protein